MLDREPFINKSQETQNRQWWRIYFKIDPFVNKLESRGVSYNISPPVHNKVFHWFEWFRSRTNRGQRLKTLPRHYRYLEYKALIVHLCTCKKAQHEMNQSNQNMIY